MEIIYFLVPIGIVMLVVAIGLFSWAVRSDQFDDLDREGRRILFDEDRLVEDRVNTAKKPQAPPTLDPAPPTTTDVMPPNATTTTPTERPQDGTKP